MINKDLFIKPIFLMFLTFFFLMNGIKAQNSLNKKKEADSVSIKIVKLLSGNTDISFLTGFKEVYAFNFRIILEKKSNKVVVVEVKATDSIGYRIFPTYKGLMSLDYSGFLLNQKKATLVIPILILNNPFDYKNPNENLKSLTKNSITELISSLIYKTKSSSDLYEDNIILFRPFLVNRMEIE